MIATPPQLGTQMQLGEFPSPPPAIKPGGTGRQSASILAISKIHCQNDLTIPKHIKHMTAETLDYPAFHEFAQNILHRFTLVVHPVIDRIEPTNPMPEVSEAIASWRSARATLADAISQKYRASEIAPLLADVESSSRKLLQLADNKSPLEVSADIATANTICDEFAHKNAQFRHLYTSEHSLANESPAEWQLPPSLNEIQELKNSIKQLEDRIEILRSSIVAGENNFAASIEPLQKRYIDALAGLDAKTPELQAKSDQIDDLLAFTSKKVLTGTYQDQANLEKTAADGPVRNFVCRGRVVS